MTPLVVLDTNLVRQAQEPTFSALRSKGYRLAISKTVVTELAARAFLGTKDSGPTPGLFFGPARTVAPYLDSASPVTPEKDEMRRIVLVDGAERERLWSAAISEHRIGWEALLASDTDDLLDFGRSCAESLDDDGEFATRMNELRACASQGVWRDHFNGFFGTFDTDPLITERLHAMVSVMAVRCAKMASGTQGFKNRTPNDTPDVMMLGQIGLGAFVATNDKRLLQDVRDSGTYQSPWVRTADEFPAADSLPDCLPWGEGARLCAERFANEGGRGSTDG